jgi:uncharacterized membrane protein YoaK (UPF0700 family)
MPTVTVAGDVIESPSPDARAERRLAIGLALIAGYVDAYGIVALGTFVSFMSGNTTRAGSFAGQGNFVAALPPTLAIVFFVAGGSAGTWLTHSALRHSRRILLGVVAALLAVVIGVAQLGSLAGEVAVVMLSLAMGMMNITQSKLGMEKAGLTFVTGYVLRLGSYLALAVKRAPPEDAQGPWDTHFRRARVQAGLWAAFVIGAALSGPATAHFGVWVLLPPVMILAAIALVSVPPAPDSAPIDHPVRSSLRRGRRSPT